MDFDSIVHSAFAAAQRGAALVYHQILATGVEVKAWEADNPQIAALVEQGVTYATGALTRFGLPVGAISVVGEDILAALKALAAGDATVPSVGTVTTTVVSETAVAAPAVDDVAPAAA